MKESSATVKSIDEYLVEDCGGKFADKTWLFGLFGSMVYVPTGEKVTGGFRYFACELPQVVEAFEARALSTLLELPFALDDDGEPDTSTIVVDLHYTSSGSAVAMQVREYQNSEPVPVTPVILLEGPDAKAIVEQVKQLDQSN